MEDMNISGTGTDVDANDGGIEVEGLGPAVSEVTPPLPSSDEPSQPDEAPAETPAPTPEPSTPPQDPEPQPDTDDD